MKTFLLCLFLSFSAYGQKKTYDLISYLLPPGWLAEEGSGGLQLSIHKDGEYAIALLLKAVNTEEGSLGNFQKDWQKLVKGTVSLLQEVVMQAPVVENGWEIQSGKAPYQDGAQKGIVTLLTATRYGKTVSTILLTNTALYQNDLLSLLESLEIEKAENTITGLWVDYLNETSGQISGIPQYTGGYFRQEYRFHANGEYEFRLKNNALLQKEIIYSYEKGKYSVSGPKLSLQPSESRSERWSKGPAGKRLSTTPASTAPRTYDFHFESKTGDRYLKMQPGNLNFKAYTKSMIADQE